MVLRSTLTAGLVLFVSFCGTVQADPPSPGWSIVWQDEFESGTVDTGKWNVNDRQDYDEYGRQSRFHPDNIPRCQNLSCESDLDRWSLQP